MSRHLGLLDRLRALFSRRAGPKVQLPVLPPSDVKVTYLKERQVSRASLAAKPLRRQRIWRYVALSVAAIVVAVGVTLALLVSHQTTLPDELVGQWRTDEPAYATRRIEILAGQLAFQSADDQPTLDYRPIVRVYRRRHALGMLYSVEYIEAGEATYFHFVHAPPLIYLANQTEFAWRRVGPASSGAPRL